MPAPPTGTTVTTAGAPAPAFGPPPCTYRPPRSSDATAATRHAAMAKSNAADRPWENGGEISAGKKPRPVR
ncbi:hypothetical protein [Streptomyces sp. NPDC059455]|uniref:hypothetical protein n=1 Tax=Streptomyces sp. NPDC059455 TaxID=3346837 RepID=UPI0036BFCBE8